MVNEKQIKIFDVYNNYIHPKMNGSKDFPVYTYEDVFKEQAVMQYKQECERLNKPYERPMHLSPLISQNGWMLISTIDRKDVNTTHYSIGFDGEDKYWAGIVCNSIDSIRQFNGLDDTKIDKLLELFKQKNDNIVIQFAEKIKLNSAGSVKLRNVKFYKLNTITKQDLEYIKTESVRIDNFKDGLFKPYISIIAKELGKEQIAGVFLSLEDIYQIIINTVPINIQIKNNTKKLKELNVEMEQLVKILVETKKQLMIMTTLQNQTAISQLNTKLLSLSSRLDDINNEIQTINNVLEE